MVFSIKLSPLFGILVFIPSVMSTIGLLQARNKFCAAYGLASRQNVSLNLGVTIQVEDEISQRKDRNKAFNIIFQSIVYSIFVTILTIISGFILLQMVL